MKKKIFILTWLVAFAILPSFAQVGQTGGITGTVTIKDDGSPLPGVMVTLKSPAMVLDKMTALTNARGVYRFVNLNPGRYELTFEMSGFATFVRKDIVVNANLTFTVNVQLNPEKIEEIMIVTGQAPTIDRLSTVKTTTLDTEFLESVPAARSLATYFNMAPGITGDSAQGAAVRDNTYSLDGIKMNDPVVGSSPGQLFSVDIMEEVSVQTSGLGAEHGSVKGAAVNVVTKSGGNRFSGSLSAYYNHKNFQSDNTKGTPLEGSLSGPKYELEPNFNLGGPIIKDRLWFFVNMGLYKSESYVAGFPHDKPEGVPIKRTTPYPYAKITYQPSQSDKFVVAYNYSNQKNNNRAADKYQTEDTTWNQDAPAHVFSAIWTHTFGSFMYTNLKIGSQSNALNLTVKKNVGWVEEDTTFMQSGSYGFDDLNPRKRLQANFDGTLYLDNTAGSHELKFGFEANRLQGQRKVIPYGEKDAVGMARLNTYTWYGEPYYAAWGAGHDRIDRSFNLGVFVNDAWKITKNLSLNLGVRFDYNRNYFPAQNGSIGDVPSIGSLAHIGFPDQTWNLKIDKAITAFTWKNFSPRLGLVYDLFGDGKTILKTNFSRYLQDNYTTISFELHPVNWIWYEGYTDALGKLSYLTYTFVPGVDIKVGYKDHSLKTPNTYEFSVGLEREIVEDLSVSARYVRRWDRNMIETADGTVVDMDALMSEGKVTFSSRWQKVEVVDPNTGKTVPFYHQLYWQPRDEYMVNPPDLKRDYNGLEFTFKKRFSKGWALDISYTYNNAKGQLGTSFWQSEGRTGLYDNPNNHVNTYGHVDLERRNQLKVIGMVKGPLGINLSTVFAYLSGRPYTRTIRSKDFGYSWSETVNAEPRGSSTLPSLILLDFRLEKEFRIGESKIKVFGDVFNTLNQGKATGVQTVSSSSTLVYGRMTSIQDPRVFRLGARIEFNL